MASIPPPSRTSSPIGVSCFQYKDHCSSVPDISWVIFCRHASAWSNFLRFFSGCYVLVGDTIIWTYNTVMARRSRLARRQKMTTRRRKGRRHQKGGKSKRAKPDAETRALRKAFRTCRYGSRAVDAPKYWRCITCDEHVEAGGNPDMDERPTPRK